MMLPSEHAQPVRTIALWVPDWPVVAWRREQSTAESSGQGAAAVPVAIVHAGQIVACSSEARRAGVRRGQRRRDAQARCPELAIAPHDPARDMREFSPVVGTIEQHSPGVQILRPGLCLLAARGPARYYGGEHRAALVLCSALDPTGTLHARAGIADGPFTAEQAARHAPDGSGGSDGSDGSGGSSATALVIPPGGSASFLAPLPLTALGNAELAGLLVRLGIRTLGGFASLDPADVSARFGPHGRHLHGLANGADSTRVTPRTPPPDLDRAVDFEPPLELADQVAFAIRQSADDVVSALAERGLVCTALRIEIADDTGRRSERVWLHPTFFEPAEIVDRVRWQLEPPRTGAGGAPAALSSSIARVHISPETIDTTAHHTPQLFGQRTDPRVHHVLSRVQGMLGHRGVTTPALGGGRLLAERQRHIAWGDRAASPADRQIDSEAPWPGHLPPPLPTMIFATTVDASVVDASGTPVTIDGRGVFTAAPAGFTADDASGRRSPPRTITAWAGPWGLREREWDRARRTIAHRVQIVDDDERAWLLVFEHATEEDAPASTGERSPDDSGRWRIEGVYD